MTDIGLLNHIKKALSEGKTKTEIDAGLLKGGLAQSVIDQAYVDAQNNVAQAPMQNNFANLSTTRESYSSEQTVNRPTIITVLCGYIFVSLFVSAINLIYFSVLGPILNPGIKISPMGALTLESGIALIVNGIALFALFGYWGMQKWGVYAYASTKTIVFIYTLLKIFNSASSVKASSLGSTVVGTGVTVAVTSLIISFLVPFAIIYYGFKYLDDMS